MREIKTWQQGQFIDKLKYKSMSNEQKAIHRKQEQHLVRPSPEGNAICRCPSPDDAAWIAQRLNLAAKLERMARDYATGVTDGSEIAEFVRKTDAG